MLKRINKLNSYNKLQDTKKCNWLQEDTLEIL